MLPRCEFFLAGTTLLSSLSTEGWCWNWTGFRPLWFDRFGSSFLFCFWNGVGWFRFLSLTKSEDGDLDRSLLWSKSSLYVGAWLLALFSEETFLEDLLSKPRDTDDLSSVRMTAPWFWTRRESFLLAFSSRSCSALSSYKLGELVQLTLNHHSQINSDCWKIVPLGQRNEIFLFSSQMWKTYENVL